MPHRLTTELLSTEAELRALIGGDPAPLTVAKVSPKLNALTRTLSACCS